MSKSKSFGGIPLTMSWYTGKFPGSDLASSRQPTRQSGQGSSDSAQMAQRPQQQAPVINAHGAGDSIELKLAPVQQDSQAMGPRGGGWGDDFGKEEGVGAGWSSAGWGQGNRHDGGRFGVDTGTNHQFMEVLVLVGVLLLSLNGRIKSRLGNCIEIVSSFDPALVGV